MWDTSGEPPGEKEGGSSDSVMQAPETCEPKNPVESLEETLTKSKPSSKKQEEVQEYARRLSKIKSRTKLSRRNKEGNVPPRDTSHTSDATFSDTADNVSQAKTAKAKSTLLQKKLAEDRKVFEQRNKERTETKRAVEEKVEAIRQQLDEKDVSHSDLALMNVQKDQLSVTPIKPVVITSEVMSPVQIETIREKEIKIAELNNKIVELEASIVDLQENLKEKDSVIESKTKAVTLMSADLSKKGKTTLDTLEDTKDEMRTMQQHFVLMESSLKSKNENLLMQLQERDNKITELEESLNRYEQEVNKQKLSESASADFSRSTMDTLVETKEAMKSMQENFVLIESSLKAKNDNLLQQLQDYEIKLAEANQRIFKFESGAGIERDPAVEDLQYKLGKLENSHKKLHDEKYELQKSVADLQDKIVNISAHGNNGAVIEKDNRIVELENLVEELKQSNKLLEEESKVELQKLLADMTLKNEEYANKITDLENLVHKLEEEKSDIAARLPDESTVNKDEKMSKLTKELEDLNRSMIKIKAQHKSKIKNLQKQLEGFKMVSDTNAELVRLANQVALLEEEKGNLQLNLVDFDELKASAGDWQEQFVYLESKVSDQAKEIEMQIEAIAALENQKLDLMQELHMAKQEISSLEAENAESENLRVTAEMKVVDFEEQLEALQKLQNENKLKSSLEENQAELIRRIEVLTQENTDLYSRISKMEEKGAYDTGSTESFEAIQEMDKGDLLKKVEDLIQKNNELTLKLNKVQEVGNSHAGSTESFETINETDKNELLKKIDQLTQENTDLTMKLSRMEEKGSSDTGSTESFDRIPEHNESTTKIDLLTQENNELVIKLTKLEEHLENIESNRKESKSDEVLKLKVDNLLEENSNQSVELSNLRAQLLEITLENTNLQKQIEILTAEVSNVRSEDLSEKSKREIDLTTQIDVLLEEKVHLEKEIKELRNTLEKSREVTSEDSETSHLSSRVEELLKENEKMLGRMSELERLNEKLKEDLATVIGQKDELYQKINQILPDEPATERLEFLEKLEKLNKEKQQLNEQVETLLEKLNKHVSDDQALDKSIVATLEQEIGEAKKMLLEQTGIIGELETKLASKQNELEEKDKAIRDYQASEQRIESLEVELTEMREKLHGSSIEKALIEEEFNKLQKENGVLLEEKQAKDAENNLLKQQLQDITTSYESKIQTQLAEISEKENDIVNLKEIIQEKDQELHAKYTELQNKMIAIDSLQDELTNLKILIQEKDALLMSTSEEIANLNNAMRSKEEEIASLRREVSDFNEKVVESKPLKDYNELLEQLKNKDMILDETQYRINATTKENSNLLEKVKDLSQQNDEMEQRLSKTQQELSNVLAAKEHLDVEFAELKNGKDQDEKRIQELQNSSLYYTRFVEDLQEELRNGYKQIEQLKLKHTEDMELQNQRIENLITDLQSKTQEYETLHSELLEKDRLVGQNVTEEVKIALEAKVAETEQKLKNSEEKIQMQLERMKKIAANLKKKSSVCQELETRVRELEEKWMTEKDEKEAKNKQIQDVEILMREKDNQIADLEEKLMQAKSESAEAFTNINKLTSDLTNSKEKMSLLVQQMTEIEEETVRVKTELDSLTAELATEKEMKQNVISDYETYKQEIAKENERKQLELDEVKEQARELSVRMQVMEAEYVEQLGTIKNLIAENALLSSKQSQINEKLENVEKESEDRRVLLEQMQKETNTTTEATTQTVEEEVGEDESKIPGTQHCNHCEQCQTVVQALEAKLQEQEAEIDNLDNELANSIGTLVHMRESIRYNDLMNQTAMRNRSLEDPYNELMLQYDALASNHEEVKAKLDEALKENKELLEKIEGLQSTNSTLEENVAASEQALEANKLENVDFLNSELMKKCEVSESKLLNVQQQLQHIQEHAAQLEQQLQSQTALLKSEEEQRMQAEQLLENAKSNYAQEITSLKVDQNATEKTVEDLRLELEAYKNQSESCVEKSISKREVSPRDFATNERDNVPQLFDASKIFGTTSVSDSNLLGDAEVHRLQALLSEKEAQYSNLTQEVSELQRQIIEERSQMSQNYSQCVVDLETSKKELFAAQENLERVEHLLTEKDRHIESLNADLRNLSSQPTDELAVNAAKETIEKLIVERDQQNVLLESCKLQISTLEGELRNSTDSELIQDLESRISNVTKERDLLQLQVSDLTRSLEKMKNSTGPGNLDLQIEIEQMARERDEAKEMVANLTRSLEDAYKAAEKTPTITDSSTKESTPLEESVLAHTEPDSSKLAVGSVKELTAPSDTWDVGSSEKLNVDEETWGWNEEDAELVGGQVSTTLIPSTEIQLRAQVDDLQDRIRDLENEKDRLTEENKHIQLRSGKMIKKLKEYKVQVENLQQQLKIQKSTSDFYELDSAIEEELKSQISKLEKALNEVKEEQKNMLIEKDALMKRLDILVAANERYMEMKERQCMDMEVLRIRNKELSDKVQFLENSLQKSAADVQESDAPREVGPVAPEEETKSVDRKKRSVDGEDLEVLCKKYKDEVDDLKDEMEALAAENEQLQHFLEEQKGKLSVLESKRSADENESIQIVEDLNKRISELQNMLSKSREEYELLRKQYEQSLMDANDQVSAMRQNADFLKEETFDKISKLEMNIADLHMQLEASESNAKSLQTSLQEAVLENTSLKEKLSDATALSENQLSCMDASMAEVTELLNVRIQEVADLKQALQKQYIDHEEVNMKLQESMQQQNQEIDANMQQVKRLEAALEASVNTCSQEKEQELDLLRRILAERESAQESLQLNLASLKEQLLEKEQQASENEKTVCMLSTENKGYMEAIEDLQKRLKEAEDMSSQVQDYVSRIQSLEQELEGAKATLVEKETALRHYTQESAECKLNLESTRAEINEYRTELQKADALRNELLEKTEQINRLSAELQAVQVALNEARENLNEKGTLLEKSTRKMDELQIELNRLSAAQQEQPRQSSSEIIDGLPVFRMGDNSDKLQQMVDSMQAELDRRQEEIEHFKYILNENTYPSIIQEMQNRIDGLYNEKAELTYSLEAAALQSEEKDKQIDSLMQRIETQSQELVSKEDATVSTKIRRSVEDQEEIVQLQNDLHVKEQEINELKYMIAEKDSQLSLQASMEPQSDEFELREMVQRLTTELYAKEQEIQQLKLMIAGLQQEVARLQDFERLSDETRNAIQRLEAEKEQVRIQAQEFLEQKLKEKEAEINEIKERLSIENSNILGELRLREADIENMKIELEDCSLVERRLKDMLNSREDELIQMSNDLAEKERRLAELSITKDTELHVLKVLIHEKDVRIEELLALSDEEEKQLKELKNTLEARETEIISLKTLLEDKVKEYELIQNVLKKDVPIMDASAVQSAQASGEESRTSTSQELDLALYMLHQRDVRCEELTHELMQLLEERDTLQLRLSNAIRVNEELRKGGSPDVSLTQEPSVSGSSEPLIEHPSPSKSEGPVEIAKEAIDAPIGEDKDTLALKLSQLHTVSHAKDVRLRDERELRHTQQMSLLAHKDVLSTLPPEAAARLVNANYTLSRDVQSQSSVLLNWLWGKSTPKVVHM